MALSSRMFPAVAMAQPLALSLLVLVLALCNPWTQGSDGGAQDCCLRYNQKTIPIHAVRSYWKQELSLGRPLTAILFVPRKCSQVELCADSKETWVQRQMKHLDKAMAPQKRREGCGEEKGASKPGMKRRDSKVCKRIEQPTERKRG